MSRRADAAMVRAVHIAGPGWAKRLQQPACAQEDASSSRVKGMGVSEN